MLLIMLSKKLNTVWVKKLNITIETEVYITALAIAGI